MDRRVTLDESTYADLYHHTSSSQGLSALASRCVRVGLAALLADSSLERQATLPTVAPPAAPKPVEPTLPESMRAVLSRLNGSAVEGTAEELCAQGFGANASGLSHTTASMAKRGLLTREAVGFRAGSHGSPVTVWRIAKAVKP